MTNLPTNPSEATKRRNPTEKEVRKLRDAVYLKPISDESWQNVRDNWMRPDSVKWLRDRLENEKARITPSKSQSR